MASFEVRRANGDDLVAVLAVHVSQGNRADGKPSARERETWDQMMATQGLAVYVAEACGCVVGTATTITLPNITYECCPTLFVEAVVVVPNYRRRGVATMIMRHLLSDALNAGCNRIQLLSHKRHATDGAHRLYAALGFQAEAEGFRLYLGEVPEAVRDFNPN